MTRFVAVIGTAGRDRSPLLTRELWDVMCADLLTRIHVDDILVSGGAAWADHLAVMAFLEGRCAGLELYLPAPIHWEIARFIGPNHSSASAANFYHTNFSKVVGFNSMEQIVRAIKRPDCEHTSEASAVGYAAMFKRNRKVAQRCNCMLAYTMGSDDRPTDGGTLDTWDNAAGKSRTHVSLTAMLEL